VSRWRTPSDALADLDVEIGRCIELGRRKQELVGEIDELVERLRAASVRMRGDRARRQRQHSSYLVDMTDEDFRQLYRAMTAACLDVVAEAQPRRLTRRSA
jgi:hypothetical protein